MIRKFEYEKVMIFSTSMVTDDDSDDCNDISDSNESNDSDDF